MKLTKSDLTHEALTAYLRYDADTGFFFKLAPGKKSGKRIGFMGAGGVMVIQVGARKYTGPRLAWFYVKGHWPTRTLRYIDDNPYNLAFRNLKTALQNTNENRAFRMRLSRANPDKRDLHKNNELKKMFAITLHDYRAKLAAQGGVCAVCREPERDMRNGELKALAVDHDHHTGQIRDLLCGGCNRAIGNARENPETLRRAAAYLERHAGKVTRELPDNVVPLKGAS